MPLTPSRTVRELRELRDLTEDEGGAQRVAWTETWAEARRWLREKLAELPVEIATDAAGNVWATLAGDSPHALVIGGHLDSVPGGGWLDGALNVVAGLEVLRRIAESGLPPVTVRLVDWADEEGARFGRTCFGSGAASGSLRPDDVRHLRDRDGVALPDALTAFGVDLDRINDAGSELQTAAAYLELHIEQGPVLESLGLPLGVVTGTAGVERHRVRFVGERAHAGSTPMANRKDAFVAAAELAVAVSAIAAEHGGVGTVGTVTVTPGIVTAVPGTCEIGIDERHLDPAALADMIERTRTLAAQIVDRDRMVVEWEALWQIQPIPFDRRLIELATEAVKEVAADAPLLGSGALHDAAEVAKTGIPTVMLFVQSLAGISHSPAEDTRPADIELAVDALDRLASKTIDHLLARS